MPINLPFLTENSVPKALVDILKLEGAQGSLPESSRLLGGSLAAYAAGMAGSQFFEHSWWGSILFGLLTAGLLYGSTRYVLRFAKSSEKFTRTLTALAAMGAIAALAYILLHFVFAMALPPPLPTDKLLRFLLFPIVVWNVFMFAFLYRNAKLRAIPSFAVAVFYVIIVDAIMSPLLK